MTEITVNEIFSKSKSDLHGKWGTAIGLVVIYMIIYLGLSLIPYVGKVSFLILGPFIMGIAIFALNLVDNKEISINQLFDGFKFHFQRSFVAYLLMTLFIILWSLLLIVPGVIAAISYSQTFYIMAENPEIEPMQAIDQSKLLMEGYKLQYFIMVLALVGLGILCIFTIGIGFLWLAPFTKICTANFYRRLAGEKDIDFDYRGEQLPLAS